LAITDPILFRAGIVEPGGPLQGKKNGAALYSGLWSYNGADELARYRLNQLVDPERAEIFRDNRLTPRGQPA